MALTRADLSRIYRDILLRDVEAQTCAAREGEVTTLDALEQELLASAEYAARVRPLLEDIDRWPGPKLLLFGAYGNGNIGDDIQADALARLMKTIDPAIRCWSTSCFARPYPAASHTALPSGAVFSRRLLRHFDLLVIGGGGLLAHPHVPLDDESWVLGLPIPHLLLGVGANGSFGEACGPLVQRAAFVGGRDVNAVASMMRHRPDVSLLPDPVLADIDAAAEEGDPAGPTCWILRSPIEASPLDVALLIEPGDRVLAMEPALDAALLARFPQVELISSLDRLLERMRGCRRVVSMRYHGIILGLKLGIPSFSLGVSKGDDLLTFLGLTTNVVGNNPERLRHGGLALSPGTLAAQRALFLTTAGSWIRSLCNTRNRMSDMTDLTEPALVEMAYRGLLGREPESAAVVEQHCQAYPSGSSFLRAVVRSDEYVAKNARRRDYRMLERRTRIDSDVDDETMTRISAHTRAVWTRYGRDDPYYSVLTNKKFVMAAIDQAALDEFYRTGSSTYQMLASVLQDHGRSFADTTVVDFGCGVGRIGVHVAADARHYIGVDISAPHLTQAQEKFLQTGRNNGEFILLEDFLKSDRKADIIFSLIVLQHNPPPVIKSLIGELCRKLTPGGILIFQVPTTLSGYTFNATDYLAAISPSDVMEMHALPTPQVLDALSQNRCVAVDVFEHDMIGPIGISTVFVAAKSA